MRATSRTLNVLAPSAERLRIVDLGCLEGGYSIEFARRGYEVVGIDARQLNIDRARAARDDLGLDRLEFYVDDVKNLADYGTFDVVFCSGLLYHLDEPRAFLPLLGRLTRRALILNTHYARTVAPRYDDDGDDPSVHAERTDFSLSELSEHEGLPGRWYPEYDADAPRDAVESDLWAAFSNDRSFWPTKPALLGACREAGFDVVYEQHDLSDDIANGEYVDREDRGLFVCIKTPSLVERSAGLMRRARDLASSASGRIDAIRGR